MASSFVVAVRAQTGSRALAAGTCSTKNLEAVSALGIKAISYETQGSESWDAQARPAPSLGHIVICYHR